MMAQPSGQVSLDHSSDVTGCAERREYFTSAMSANHCRA